MNGQRYQRMRGIGAGSRRVVRVAGIGAGSRRVVRVALGRRAGEKRRSNMFTS